MSSESGTCLFPDRPIRPLPKHRLRERLSPDVADSIKYPPAPQTTPALFSYPVTLKSGVAEEAEVTRSGNRDPRSTGRQSSRRHGPAGGSDSDDAAVRRAVVARPLPETLGRSGRHSQKAESSRYGQPQTPPSTTSSGDGYDSFENTNNKKKRKIPTAGEINGGHGLNDTHTGAGGLATLVTPGDRSGGGGGATSAPYYGSGSYVTAGQHVSGPGKGRFGRVRNGRSPLRALSEAGGNFTGRNFKIRPVMDFRPAQWSPQPEKLPATSDQENISILHQQQQSAKTNPASASTQFTFTCDSQVPGSLAWPGSDPRSANMSSTISNQAAAGSSSHSRATQTQNGPAASGTSPADTHALPTSDGGVKGGAAQSATSDKKTRRRAAKDLHMQAKKRREDTARQNYKPEDQWICEFCEYERIFGYPPVALIRQYEIKDRKLRQQEEERRRVWEKAKARSRKGKKGSKVPAKNNNIAPAHPADVHQTPPMSSNTQSQGTQSEDYDENDYEAEPDYEVDDEIPHLISEADYKAQQEAASRNMGGGTGGGTEGGTAGGPMDGAADLARAARPIAI